MKRLLKMLILNNKIQIFNNCKMENQFKERLPQSGLYNFFKWITQGHFPGCWNDYYLRQIRSHASVKQLGQPVSISTITANSSHIRKRRLHVKESNFENCCREDGLPGNLPGYCILRLRDQVTVNNNHPSFIVMKRWPS